MEVEQECIEMIDKEVSEFKKVKQRLEDVIDSFKLSFTDDKYASNVLPKVVLDRNKRIISYLDSQVYQLL